MTFVNIIDGCEENATVKNAIYVEKNIDLIKEYFYQIRNTIRYNFLIFYLPNTLGIYFEKLLNKSVNQSVFKNPESKLSSVR